MNYKQIVKTLRGGKNPVKSHQPEDVAKVAHEELEKEITRLYRNLTQNKNSVLWCARMENVCKAHFQFKLFVKRGGLNPVKEDEAHAYVQSWQGLTEWERQAAKDNDYLGDLIRWQQNPTEFRCGHEFDFYKCALALLSDDIFQYSEHHGEQPRDIWSERALDHASDNE